MRRLRLRMNRDGTCRYYGDGIPETDRWTLHGRTVTFTRLDGGGPESFILSRDCSSMSDGDTHEGVLVRLTYVKIKPIHRPARRSHE